MTPIPIQIKLVIGSVVLILVAGLMAANCAINFNDMRGCMRDGMHHMVALGLNVLAFAMGAVLGVSVAEHTGRNWAGWIVGGVVALGGSLFLLWCGFNPSSTD